MVDEAATPDGDRGEADVVASVEPESGAVEPESAAEETTEVVAVAEDADEDLDEADVDDEAEDYDEAEDFDEAAVGEPRISHVRLATIVGLVAVVALAGLVGWLGYRAYQSHQTGTQRNEFLAVGRQGAVNLTTIDFEHVDDDVKRILDSATGTFYDDFQQRSQPFVQVVKQVKSKSVGKVTEAGIESASDDEAQILVAVRVETSVAGQPDQRPRSWRMRIAVQKVGDDPKVSHVEFVP
jgi:Mce-associated membrane protein